MYIIVCTIDILDIIMVFSVHTYLKRAIHFTFDYNVQYNKSNMYICLQGKNNIEDNQQLKLHTAKTRVHRRVLDSLC